MAYLQTDKMFWVKGVFILASSFLCVSAVNEKRPTNTPCKLDDSKCLKDVTQWMLQTNVVGISELGIESSDPLKHDVVEGDLGYVKYRLSNTYIEGMKLCEVKAVRVSANLTAMRMELMCPRSHVKGEYNIEGNLLNVPIKGVGKYDIRITNFFNIFDLDITYYKQGNKLHHKHGKLGYKGQLLGQLDIDLMNMDGTKKQLSEGAQNILRFAKENAKLFIDMIASPVHAQNTKKVIKNMNKRLKAIPTTDLLQINEKDVRVGKV